MLFQKWGVCLKFHAISKLSIQLVMINCLLGRTIYIDGQDFTSSTRFPEGFQVTYAKDGSSKTVNQAISSGITFVKESFLYLENKFFPTPFDPGSKDQEAEIVIFTDCCDQAFVFIIRADAVTYCPEDCTIETQGFERSDDLKASGRLRNHRILTNQQGILSQKTPKIQYCLETNFFQNVLYTLFFVLTLPFQILGQIAASAGAPGLADAIDDFLGDIQGCFGGIRLFFIADILDEAAAAAGLTFESTIFKGSTIYNNAAWLDTRAIPRLSTSGEIQFPPQSNLNAIEFLEILSQTFNADYQIRNGVLIFERVDFFDSITSVLVNADEAYDNNRAEVAPCYQYTDQPRYAFGRYEYTQDNDEEKGNSGLFLYNEIVDFNDPFDPNKKGALNVNVPLAAARFVGDGLERDGSYGERTEGDLIITNDLQNTRSLPKILVLTGNAALTSDPSWLNAKVARRLVQGELRFNYPMFFNENESDGLYQQFWAITDPRTTPNQPYELDDFEFLFNCSQVNLIRNNGIDVLVETRLGNGTPEEIVIDFDRKTITVKGTKLAQ
jgi:hypothetical protein